jgi:DUF1009 family protein
MDEIKNKQADGPMALGSPLSALRSPRPIGLLAGRGRFPIVFAEKARSVGIPVVCVGIRSEASPELIGLVQEFHWCRLAAFGRAIRCFKNAGVERLVMAGKITKQVLYSPWRWLQLFPDWRTVRFYFSRRRADNRDDSILLGVIDEFARDGLIFESALNLCPELLVQAGTLTRRPPTAREERDITFGWQLAKQMGRLDVGQSVAVHERAVLAVEAIEGTDQAILRAGSFCRSGGFVVVKVAKPQQDPRFDVPTIGTSTIETMRQAGGKVLAIEANETILLDHCATVALADRYGITIVALPAAAA